LRHNNSDAHPDGDRQRERSTNRYTDRHPWRDANTDCDNCPNSYTDCDNCADSDTERDCCGISDTNTWGNPTR
jgi:hypothetical protein